MINAKSIRLDFLAAGIPISDKEIVVLLQDALIAAATSGTTEGRRAAARALAKAASETEVNSFDASRGGPVFYIP